MAVLGALVLGSGRAALTNSRKARARSELLILATALESYRGVHGDYPRTNDAARLLQSLLGRRGPKYAAIAEPARLELARFSLPEGADPFSDESVALLDPWGQQYRYAYKSSVPWSNPMYVLYSAGPDGVDEATLAAGGFPAMAAAPNVDNLWARQP